MRATLILLLTSAFIFLLACASGPTAPDPGTPAYYWNAAKETFSAGSFLTANDNLDLAMKSAEYKSKALPWSLVLSAGLCQGYQELADAYETGVRSAKTNATAFLRQRADLRRYAKGLALQFAERFGDFQKTNKDEQIKLVFPFPPGSPTLPAKLGEVAGGAMPTPAQIEDLQKAVIARSVILQTASAAGSGDDPNKAQEKFKTAEVNVPRAQFLFAMAKAMYDQALLFGPKKLYEPDKTKMLCERALEILKTMPDNKEGTELSEKVKKTLKDIAPAIG